MGGRVAISPEKQGKPQFGGGDCVGKCARGACPDFLEEHSGNPWEGGGVGAVMSTGEFVF